MVGPLESRLGVTAMLFKMYSGISDINHWLRSQGVDDVIRYSFTPELDKFPHGQIETAIPAVLGDMENGKLPSAE